MILQLTIGRLLSEMTVHRLGWMLVHSLWQFTLFALAAAAIMHLMRNRSASARYLVLVLVLAISAAAPVSTWWLLCTDGAADRSLIAAAAVEPGEATTASESADDFPVAEYSGFEHDFALDDARSVPATTGAMSGTHPGATVVGAHQGISWKSWSGIAVTWLQPRLAWIVLAWSLGVVICALRPVWGWRMLQRLRREGVSPAADVVRASVSRLSDRLGLRCVVRVWQSTLAQVPVVVGYLRPVILLPASLVTSIPASQLEAVLAHELAHVKRHDFVVNLLQTLIETLFFYHPAIWWLSRKIREQREHCCDDLAIQLSGNRVEYGRALVAVEEFRCRSSVLALGLAGGSLLARIRRILGDIPVQGRTPPGSAARLEERMPLASLGLVLVGVVSVLLVGWHVSAGVEAESAVRRPMVQSTEAATDGATDAELAAWQTLEGMNLAIFGEAADQRSLLRHLQMLERAKSFPRRELDDLRRKTREPIREAEFWDVPERAWPWIARLESLRDLRIVGSANLGGPPLEAIGRLHNLRRLAIVNSKCLPQDLNSLRGLTELEELDVMFTVFEESEADRQAQIGELSDEERALFDRVRAAHPNREHILQAAILTDRALERIHDLKRLKVVRLVNTFVSSRGVTTLSKFRALEELDLGVVDESPEVVELIGEMRTLKRLSGLSLTDAALANWAELKQLEELGQFAGDLSDAGAEHLLKFPRLRKLVLWHNRLTDAGLQRLAELPQLELLDVRFSKTLTSAGVEEFQRRKPGCKVSFEPAAEPGRDEQAQPAPAPSRPAVGRDPELKQGNGRDSVMSWSFDSQQLYTQGQLLRLMSWERQGETLKVVASAVPEGGDNGWFAHAYSMAVSHKPGLIVLGTNRGTVQIWDEQSLTFQKQIAVEPDEPAYATYGVALSPDGKLLAEYGSSAHLYELPSLKLVREFGKRENNRTSSLVFAPNSRLLAALNWAGELTLWSIPEGARIGEWPLKNIGQNATVQWSGDGEKMAVVSDGQIVFVTPESGSPPRYVRAPDAVCQKSPPTPLTGNQIRRTDLPEGIDFAGAMALAPDFKTVASVKMDATIALWNVKSRHVFAELAASPPASELEHPGLALKRLMFSPDGRQLAVQDSGHIVVWPVK